MGRAQGRLRTNSRAWKGQTYSLAACVRVTAGEVCGQVVEGLMCWIRSLCVIVRMVETL